VKSLPNRFPQVNHSTLENIEFYGYSTKKLTFHPLGLCEAALQHHRWLIEFDRLAMQHPPLVEPFICVMRTSGLNLATNREHAGLIAYQQVRQMVVDHIEELIERHQLNSFSWRLSIFRSIISRNGPSSQQSILCTKPRHVSS
tara:strand:- start:6102 stop:6530 length:429 start_codon:yes stop_codon:yes gene_type:complete